MLRGNISNRQSPYIFFDIDSLLFVEEEKKFFGKILDMFKSENQKYMSRPINDTFVKRLNRVWDKHDVSIGLFSTTLLDTEEIENLLNEHYVPYTRIFLFETWDDLRVSQNPMYVFSDNLNLLSYLSAHNALPMDSIWEVL